MKLDSHSVTVTMKDGTAALFLSKSALAGFKPYNMQCTGLVMLPVKKSTFKSLLNKFRQTIYDCRQRCIQCSHKEN